MNRKKWRRIIEKCVCCRRCIKTKKEKVGKKFKVRSIFLINNSNKKQKIILFYLHTEFEIFSLILRIYEKKNFFFCNSRFTTSNCFLLNMEPNFEVNYKTKNIFFECTDYLVPIIIFSYLHKDPQNNPNNLI